MSKKETTQEPLAQAMPAYEAPAPSLMVPSTDEWKRANTAGIAGTIAGALATAVIAKSNNVAELKNSSDQIVALAVDLARKIVEKV